MKNFNSWFARRITGAVSTMTCAYLFFIIAMVAFPQAVHDSFVSGFAPLPLITWLSQSMLQLVLLAIIMAGQDIAAKDTEKRAKTQFDAVMEILGDVRKDHAASHEILLDVRKDHKASHEILVDVRKLIGRIV